MASGFGIHGGPGRSERSLSPAYAWQLVSTHASLCCSVHCTLGLCRPAAATTARGLASPLLLPTLARSCAGATLSGWTSLSACQRQMTRNPAGTFGTTTWSACTIAKRCAGALRRGRRSTRTVLQPATAVHSLKGCLKKRSTAVQARGLAPVLSRVAPRFCVVMQAAFTYPCTRVPCVHFAGPLCMPWCSSCNSTSSSEKRSGSVMAAAAMRMATAAAISPLS